MATDKDYMDFVVDQLSGVPHISVRKLFGEYGVYADGLIFALVCDNKLFLKPTSAGQKFIGKVVEAPPYRGAKPRFLIEDQIENQEWLCELVRVTLAELKLADSD